MHASTGRVRRAGGALTGADVCRLFNVAIRGQGTPRHLSTDHDPLFEAHRWQANLRILEIDEIKTVPHVPLSHPFVERLIGTIRREFLDHVLFWNGRDLERKLADFQDYYNAARGHASLDGQTPLAFADGDGHGAGRPEPRALGLALPRSRPAPGRCLTTNSRPTGIALGATPSRAGGVRGHPSHREAGARRRTAGVTGPATEAAARWRPVTKPRPVLPASRWRDERLMPAPSSSDLADRSTT